MLAGPGEADDDEDGADLGSLAAASISGAAPALSDASATSQVPRLLWCRGGSGLGGHVSRHARFPGRCVLRAVHWPAHPVMLVGPVLRRGQPSQRRHARAAQRHPVAHVLQPGAERGRRARAADSAGLARRSAAPVVATGWDYAFPNLSPEVGAADGGRGGAAQGKAAHAGVDGPHPVAPARRPGAAGLWRVRGADAVRPPACRRNVPAAGARRLRRPPSRHSQAMSLHGLADPSRFLLKHGAQSGGAVRAPPPRLCSHASVQ